LPNLPNEVSTSSSSLQNSNAIYISPQEKTELSKNIKKLRMSNEDKDVLEEIMRLILGLKNPSYKSVHRILLKTFSEKIKGIEERLFIFFINNRIQWLKNYNVITTFKTKYNDKNNRRGSRIIISNLEKYKKIYALLCEDLNKPYNLSDVIIDDKEDEDSEE
jgi:hypothetical protein